MSDKDKAVVDACKKSWDSSWLTGTSNSENCSGFVKSVATALKVDGVPEAQADGLVDHFARFWHRIGSGVEARQKVRDGYFVVAGLKASGHHAKSKKNPATGKVVEVPIKNGHVAIIVDGDLYHAKYPLCWCGSIGEAQSMGNLSVGEVWSRSDRDHVGYFVYPSKIA